MFGVLSFSVIVVIISALIVKRRDNIDGADWQHMYNHRLGIVLLGFLLSE